MRWYRLTRIKSRKDKEQLRRLKLASLKFHESKLELQKKKGADCKTIHQTMKDIYHVKKEIQNLK